MSAWRCASCQTSGVSANPYNSLIAHDDEKHKPKPARKPTKP